MSYGWERADVDVLCLMLSSTKSRGAFPHFKHKTPLADVTKNHASVCLGIEGVWSLFLPLAKASTHKISLPREAIGATDYATFCSLKTYWKGDAAPPTYLCELVRAGSSLQCPSLPGQSVGWLEEGRSEAVLAGAACGLTPCLGG